MGLEDKVKAAAKNVEGKLQETAGKITDNKEAQLKGKAKQAEAEARKNVENVKDKAKEMLD